MGFRVGAPGEHEEKVAQAVEEDDQIGARGGVVQREHRTFGPAAYGAREVQRRRLRRPTRQDEARERGQPCLGGVDVPLEACRVGGSEGLDAGRE